MGLLKDWLIHWFPALAIAPQWVWLIFGVLFMAGCALGIANRHVLALAAWGAAAFALFTAPRFVTTVEPVQAGSASRKPGGSKLGDLHIAPPAILSRGHAFEVIGVRLRRTEVTYEWPVTSDDVWIGCSPAATIPAMTTVIIVDRDVWALNGLTKAQARDGTYRMVIAGQPRTVNSDKAPSWWKPGRDTPRVYLGPFFDAAQRLGCLDIPTGKP